MKVILISDFRSVTDSGSKAHTQTVKVGDTFEIRRIRVQKNDIPLIGNEIVLKQFSTFRAIIEGMAFKKESIETIVNDLIKLHQEQIKSKATDSHN